MLKTVVVSALALASVVGLAIPSAQAANARQPYTNVNKSNDKGNDTGDAQVERLNAMQLDRARGGTGVIAPGTTSGMKGGAAGQTSGSEK